MKSYKQFLKEQKEHIVFDKIDTNQYSLAVRNYIQNNPNLLKGSNNKLIKIFTGEEGNEFSRKFIEKLRNQIANNNIILREIILPRIEEVLDDLIQNFDSEHFEKMKEDINSVKVIIQKRNAKDLYSVAMCCLIKHCAEYIFDEETIRRILIRMYDKNVEGFIAEYIADKWLREVKKIIPIKPTYKEDVYKGVDLIVEGRPIQIKSIRQDGNAIIGDNTLELKNTTIQLDERKKEQVDFIYFVTPTRIIIIKTEDMNIVPNSYYLIESSSIEENFLKEKTDYNQEFPEFKEIKEIIENDKRELA